MRRVDSSFPRAVAGWFFHVVRDGKIEGQGAVLGRADGGLRVVMFDWLMGQPNDELVVPLLETRGWQWFPSSARMQEANALSRVTGPRLRDAHCPRCDAVGSVFAHGNGGYDVVWYRAGEFWSFDIDTELLQGDGCGFDR